MAAIAGSGHWATIATACSLARHTGEPIKAADSLDEAKAEPVCRPMAMQWQMPFASSRGYSSLTLQHDIAQMLARRRAKTEQLPIVYFVSDLDPSGLDLQRAWDKALQNFAVFARFERLALILDQVRDPELAAPRSMSLNTAAAAGRLTFCP
jgi:hypothetical protein